MSSSFLNFKEKFKSKLKTQPNETLNDYLSQLRLTTTGQENNVGSRVSANQKPQFWDNTTTKCRRLKIKVKESI